MPKNNEYTLTPGTSNRAPAHRRVVETLLASRSGQSGDFQTGAGPRRARHHLGVEWDHPSRTTEEFSPHGENRAPENT